MGQELERGTGTISNATRKMNIPAIIKRQAKKRYRERLLSFMARAAQKPPATKSRKARKTESFEACSREPSKNVIPSNMKIIPAIKATVAVIFRSLFDFILYNINLL